MAEKFVSIRNLRFLLYEVFDTVSLTAYDYYNEYDKKMLDMVLQAALELGEGLLWPHFQEMDRNPPELEGDTVKVHPCVKEVLRTFGEGGWIAMTVPEELDGQQLPQIMADVCQFIFTSANYSAAVYPGLCDGAARLIENFGSKDLYEKYVPHMRSGRWQGTMALTEPEAGSSLSDIVTTATPTEKEYYKIQGQKIFISGGDHGAAENVVHLMLAKIEGAPAGVKGISLFVVPKKRISESGELVSNDVVTSGIFHKLGYRGCPIAQLSIGDKNDCRGYLVGEPHNGLKYMFQMMNEARIGVGVGATAMATAAYYASLDYVGIRKQGRKISQKDPTLPPVPIIQHSDVKRMLLYQRSIVEGALSLLLQCSKYVDLKKVGDPEEKQKYGLLLDLLTPIAKSYPSEAGILSISRGLQCLGGSGYCDDYPLEQYYRDVRIHPIHEGTTGIHGIDLLGRKVMMENGKAFGLFAEEVRNTISEAGNHDALKTHAQALDTALNQLEAVTSHLKGVAAQGNPELFLADATLYLDLFGFVTIAWQWLKQGIYVSKGLSQATSEKEKHFYEGKMYALRFFYGYELPKMGGLIHRLMNGDGLTVDMETAYFED